MNAMMFWCCDEFYRDGGRGRRMTTSVKNWRPSNAWSLTSPKTNKVAGVLVRRRECGAAGRARGLASAQDKVQFTTWVGGEGEGQRGRYQYQDSVL